MGEYAQAAGESKPFVHVAIIRPQVAEALLTGRKRIESRFQRSRRAPYGRLHAGDIVHFKLAGGPLVATARVRRVEQHDALTHGQIAALRQKYGGLIGASAGYWRARRGCRFGVLAWLGPLVPPPAGIRVPRQFGSAWIVLGGPPAESRRGGPTHAAFALT